MKSSAGSKTQIGPSCEMTADAIRYHLKTLEKRTTGPSGRLVLWRLIVRTAMAEHDRELAQLDSLNSLKADPSMEVVIPG